MANPATLKITLPLAPAAYQQQPPLQGGGSGVWAQQQHAKREM